MRKTNSSSYLAGLAVERMASRKHKSIAFWLIFLLIRLSCVQMKFVTPVLFSYQGFLLIKFIPHTSLPFWYLEVYFKADKWNAQGLRKAVTEFLILSFSFILSKCTDTLDLSKLFIFQFPVSGCFCTLGAAWWVNIFLCWTFHSASPELSLEKGWHLACLWPPSVFSGRFWWLIRLFISKLD